MEKRKKAMVALLVFIIATLKSLLDVSMCVSVSVCMYVCTSRLMELDYLLNICMYVSKDLKASLLENPL